MSNSANLALPFIEGGELLPDVTLNETLRLIDTLVQLAILDRDLNAPPGSPSRALTRAAFLPTCSRLLAIRRSPASLTTPAARPEFFNF